MLCYHANQPPTKKKTKNADAVITQIQKRFAKRLRNDLQYPKQNSTQKKRSTVRARLCTGERGNKWYGALYSYADIELDCRLPILPPPPPLTLPLTDPELTLPGVAPPGVPIPIPIPIPNRIPIPASPAESSSTTKRRISTIQR